ncbi:MAG TPA: hypothetical protein VIF12_04920, partial [Micavibrio sp.]
MHKYGGDADLVAEILDPLFRAAAVQGTVNKLSAVLQLLGRRQWANLVMHVVLHGMVHERREFP